MGKLIAITPTSSKHGRLIKIEKTGAGTQKVSPPVAPLEKKPAWNGAQGGAERPITTQALAPQGKQTRLYNAITGAGKSYGAGVVNTGGVVVKAGQWVNTQAGQERLKIKAAEDNIAGYQKKLQNKALTAEEKARYQTLIAVNRRNIFAAQSLQNAGNAPTERLSQSLYRKADALRGGAQTDISEAKAGLGKLGSLAVDAGVAGAQMAGDAALAAATGGTALVPMAVRSFGSGAQEARQAGGDFSDQILYGAGSAATEVLTEKMFSVAAPFKRMFGAGFLDKAIKNAVAKLPVQLGRSAVGKVLLSAGSEAAEEFVSAAITPVLQRATFDRNAAFDLDGALYDALVGGVLGLAGGGVGAVMDRGKQKSAPGAGTPLADEVWNETGHSRRPNPVELIDTSNADTGPLPAANETPPALSRSIIQPMQNSKGGGTASALDRLGVKISGDLANYRGADFVRSDNQGEKSVKAAVKKAEIRLEPTKAEKAFASGIAEGLFTSADIPKSMERGKVEELAGYYVAERSYQRPSGVKERGRELREKVDSLAANYFEDTEKYKPISMLLMNERTPERVMRSIFGDQQGEKINDAYIYPVQKNEAEKLRFTQRMLDAVRTFSDSTGEKSHLNKQERIIVQQMVEDKFVGETVASMETSGMIRAAAETIKSGKDAGDAYREFGLNEKEQGLAQQLSRWMVNQELLESGELDAVKIENAVKKYSEQFDLFYEAINDFLVAHGYDTIGFIKGYAPHMQGVDTQNKLVSALKALGVNTDAASLPTSISGLTAEYKPGKRWNPYFQSRVGNKTDYDIAKAYESYVGYMGDILYHTDDIARLRGVSRYLRKTYGSEEITATIEKAESLRNAKLETQVQALKNAGKTTDGTTLSYEDARKQIDAYIDELYDDVQHLSKYGELVKYIDNFANLLAGKQSMADRGMEYMTGRTSLNAGNKLVSAFGRAQVAGNLSSVLNQSAQLSQILAELDGRSLVGAIKDLANATGGRPWAIKRSALFQQSDLLAGKRGVDYLTAGDSKLDQFVTAIFKPADMMDSLVSAIAVQGKYHQLLERGTPATEALMEADRFATNIMGSRLKGSRPLAFESKSLISQMLHMFQLEALNGWEHITQDVPLQYRKIAEEHGNRAGARALATMATKGIVSAFLLNRIAEAAYGGTPAPFDLLGYIANFVASGLGMSANDWLKQLINSGWKELFGEALLDEEEEEKKPFDAGAATEDLLYNVSNDIPFLRNVTGLLGLGDQTMPLANMAGSVEAVGTAAKNAGIFSGEMGNALLSLGGQTLPGGRQLQKTAQGLQTMTSGGRIYGYGDKQRLQYPVKSSAVNWGQALLFGNTGLSETRDFYASGESGLTARQTKIWQGMVKDGASSQTVYNAIQRVRAGADTAGKLRALDQAKLTDTEKLKIYTGIIATDESKRPDDFRRLMKNGMTWQQVSDAYAMYLKLNGTDGLSATEKATQFAKWADMSNLQPEHRAAVKAEMGFYSQARADAGRYTELTEAGLNPSKAEKLTAALGALEPKRGETTVSDVQKYRTVVEYGLSETDQMAALESLMEDTAYEKLEAAYHAGISPSTFVQFKERTEDFTADHDANGKTISGSKKQKVLAEIDAMPLSGNQKTALYYAAGYKESTLDDAPWYGKLEPVGSEYLLPAGKGKLVKIK